MGFDLGIEGGEGVSSRGRARVHVYIEDGRVALLSGERQEARERVDADGLFVMPGMVDAHVHFMDPGDNSREDFPTGSAAAARAGVTTVIEHTHAAPVISGSDLVEKSAYLGERSVIDFGLAAHAWPDRIAEVAGVWRAGAAFVKAFSCNTHGIPAIDAAAMQRMFEQVARAGAVCLVHAEDDSMTALAERELRASGRDDGGIVPAWRNPEAELTALGVTATCARATGARVAAAHVSHPAALEAARGLVIESCPQYLLLREAEVLDLGPFRKFTPPARAHGAHDLEAMWHALADGRIDYISSDHAPSTAEQKTAGSIWDVHFGLPGVDTTLSVLLDGARAEQIGYERVVEVYSEAPARLYGMWPAKGSLEPGSDADIVLVDPAERWTVSNEDVLSKAGWSPFAGRTLTGRAVATYSRGRLVADRGEVVGKPGDGRFVPGAGYAAN
jgi:dihydroorotase (multifunctional complex type)